MLYEPGAVADEVDIVRVDAAEPPEDRVTPVLVSLTVGGSAVFGIRVLESVTVPLKLLRLASAMVEFAPPPSWRLIDEGLVDMEKSGLVFTETRRVVECERDPLVPVTVTV
jgi:hypothetical protein